MPRALVTGATGQVGQHVIDRLRRDGWEVRALVRDAARGGALSRAGVSLATGDVLDATGLAVAARGCDLVVHAAAVVTARGGWELYQRTNVEGTRHAIAAAEAAGARLVQVSSVAVYGDQARHARGGGGTTEATPLSPLAAGAWYARSKRESEALVLAAHAEGRVWATAVRPDVIYGAHDRQFVPRIARLLAHGVAPLVGGGHTRLAVVHAANVADGIVRAATTDTAGGRAYNLANDFDVTVREFFDFAAEGMGSAVRRLPIPYAVARVALALAGVVSPLVAGNRFRAPLAASLDFLASDNPFDSSRARRELGWAPAVTPAVGVPDAFRWWRQHRA